MKLENEHILCNFHQRGAALDQFIVKSINRNIVRQCENRSQSPNYINSITGPIANRISGAEFSIEEEIFSLNANENGNTLHGGKLGLSQLHWDVINSNEKSMTFFTELKDGHMGFPGPSKFEVNYQLQGYTLSLDIQATSPRKNAFNLVPHFFFNLTESENINNHLLQVHANHYLPVNASIIPTGKIEPVNNTRFDFRAPKLIQYQQLDHNFCLNEKGMREIARLSANDIELQIESNQPGLQVYDSENINRRFIAIEPQGWPNAVNQVHFPQQLINANQPYLSSTRLTVLTTS